MTSASSVGLYFFLFGGWEGEVFITDSKREENRGESYEMMGNSLEISESDSDKLRIES